MGFSFFRLAGIGAGVVGVCSLGACFTFGDLSGDGDAGSTADGSVVTSDGSTAEGGGGEDAANPDAGPLGPCKGNQGPTMVRTLTDVNHYCIDSTEVTNRQYSQFLQSVADAGLPVTPPAACSWNTDLTNGLIFPINDKPRTNVDWCDAWSYCHWANKRLCGKIGGGGPTTPPQDGDPKQSEWMNACARNQTDGGVQPYTYGYTYDPSACNGAEVDAGIQPVASFPKCVGAYPGVFDLLGNADEWVDSCVSDTGSTDCCPTQGGGVHDTNLGCGVGFVPTGDCTGRTRADVHSDVGFRCCSN